MSDHDRLRIAQLQKRLELMHRAAPEIVRMFPDEALRVLVRKAFRRTKTVFKVVDPAPFCDPGNKDVRGI